MPEKHVLEADKLFNYHTELSKLNIHSNKQGEMKYGDQQLSFGCIYHEKFYNAYVNDTQGHQLTVKGL